jgi:hypothetical protein
MIVGVFKPHARLGLRRLDTPVGLTSGSARTELPTLGPTVEMRRLPYHARQAGPVILYPFALILGCLLWYGAWLVLVGIFLPVFVQVVGAD